MWIQDRSDRTLLVRFSAWLWISSIYLAWIQDRSNRTLLVYLLKLVSIRSQILNFGDSTFFANSNEWNQQAFQMHRAITFNQITSQRHKRVRPNIELLPSRTFNSHSEVALIRAWCTALRAAAEFQR